MSFDPLDEDAVREYRRLHSLTLPGSVDNDINPDCLPEVREAYKQDAAKVIEREWNRPAPQSWDVYQGYTPCSILSEGLINAIIIGLLLFLGLSVFFR